MDQSNVQSSPAILRYALLAILAAALLPFLPALQNGFVYDDHFQVEANPYIRNFDQLKILFTEDVWEFSPATRSNNYRPVHMFSYLLVYQMAGLSPFAFHLLNLLLNVVSVLLLWRVALFYVGSTQALACAIIFAVHPVHTEAVVWIGGTHELLCAVFLIGCFLLYLNGKQVVSVIIFFLALLSKETALVFPGVIVADTVFFRRERAPLYRWLTFGAFAMVVYTFLRVVALDRFMERNPIQVSLAEQVFAAISFAGLYVWKAVAPFSLNAFYHFSMPISAGWFLRGAVVVALWLALLLWFRRKMIFVFGNVWFAILIVPALVVVGVSPVLFAERYLFIPTAGLCLAVCSLWHPGNRAAVLILAAITILFAAFSFQRSYVWKDDLTLWRDTIRKSPASVTVNYNLATAYLKNRNYSEAIHYYNRVVALDQSRAEAYFNMASCYYAQGDFDKASSSLKSFLRHWKGGVHKRNEALKRLQQLQEKSGY